MTSPSIRILLLALIGKPGHELAIDALREERGIEVSIGGPDAIAPDRDLAAYDCVVVDVDALQSGLEVVLARRPELPVILLAPTDAAEQVLDAVNRGAVDYVINAPGRIRRLPLAVRAAVERARLLSERARSQAETAARRYRDLFRAHPMPMWVYDLETLRFLEVNDAAVSVYGYSREQFLAMTIADIRPSADVPRLLENVQAVTPGFEAAGVWRHLRRDGTPIFVDVSSHGIDWDGRPGEVVMARDVTERERAVAALRESETRLRLALRGANQGLYDLNVQTGEALVSEEYARMLGYDPAEFHETNARWIERLHPDDREPVAAKYRAYIAGEIPEYRVEFRQRAADGQWKWILSLGAVVERDVEGRPLRMLGTHTDIDRAKRDEARIVRLSRLYETLSQMNQAVVRAASVDEVFEDICRIAVRYGGFHMAWVGLKDFASRRINLVASAGDATGYARELRISMDPESPEGRGPTAMAFREGRPYVSNDFLADPNTAPWHAGARRAGFRASAAAPVMRDGRVAGALNLYAAEAGFFDEEIIGLVQEMATDLAIAIARFDREREIAENEERFRAIFEQAAVGIAQVAPDGRFLRVNQKFCDIVGYEPGELLARTFQTVTHPDDLDADLDYLRRVLTGEIGNYGMDKRYLRKEGVAVWVHLTVSLVRGADGAPKYFVSVIEDISERKAAVEALAEARWRLEALSARLLAAQEDERRRVARELHDEVGQTLTVVKLALLTARQHAGAVAEHLDEPIRVADQAIRQVRDLMVSLRPPQLDDLGLAAALRWLLDRQSQVSGFEARLETDLPAGRLSGALESACFRLVQEAVTNVARHADATHVWVRLSQRDGYLCVTVQDDGRGFDVQAVKAGAVRGASLGILGMEERVGLLGGRLGIESSAAGGTRITAMVPLERGEGPAGQP